MGYKKVKTEVGVCEKEMLHSIKLLKKF